MSREITIILPETITINGATDAPANLREVATDKWSVDFCLTALIHGISQKIGDTWSVSKKDIAKTTAVHENMMNGDWSKRASGGISDAKIAIAIGKLDIKALLAAMTPEQHAAILAAGGDISVVTTSRGKK